MPRWCLLLALWPAAAAAEDWVKFTAGPFEVFTDAGARPGRETLVRFEQFRHALGLIVGEQNLDTPVPIRVFVFRNPQGWTTSDPIIRARDRYAIVLGSRTEVPDSVLVACTRLFLESNTARMPAAFERGLISFFSTLEIAGIRITAGKPPAQPDLDWARVHLLVTDPEYYGKLRVLLYNLRQGINEDVAYRNAFGKSAAEIEKQAARHLELKSFQTTSISSRPMSPNDFPERPVSDADARLARADLLAGPQSAAEYDALIRENLKAAESQEGLGLLALRDGRTDEARKRFAAAIDAGSGSARAFIEYARLEPDDAKAENALRRAAGINDKLDEPFFLLAQRDKDPRKRALHLQEAANRNPRRADYWKALAEAYLAVHDYGNAAKAWRSGEQAATDPAERDRMRQARMAIEQQRLDYEAAERKRVADEERRELERLKEQARAEVRALEEKFSEKAEPDEKVVPWWDGPKPSGKLRGSLKQVDCLGRQARLMIETDDRKTVRLLVADPGQITIIGGGEQALGCGAQKPRRVSVEYFPKPNAKLSTAGDVAIIEFQ
jgi:hypothetical protein